MCGKMSGLKDFEFFRFDFIYSAGKETNNFFRFLCNRRPFFVAKENKFHKFWFCHIFTEKNGEFNFTCSRHFILKLRWSFLLMKVEKSHHDVHRNFITFLSLSRCFSVNRKFTTCLFLAKVRIMDFFLYQHCMHSYLKDFRGCYC